MEGMSSNIGPGVKVVWTTIPFRLDRLPWSRWHYLLRDILAAAVGLPQHHVHVIVPEVGGGFGSKLNVYPEELVAAYAAMKLGHPVKWIEDRSENLAATTHGRGHQRWPGHRAQDLWHL